MQKRLDKFNKNVLDNICFDLDELKKQENPPLRFSIHMMLHF